MKKQSNRSSRAVTPEKSKSATATSKSNGCGGGGAEEKSNGSASGNKSQSQDDGDDWEEYLGSNDEDKSSIVIRFPDGTRESKELPCSSKFKVGNLLQFDQFSLDQ